MDSTNADALYVRGLCLYYEDCIEKAVQFFVQALRMAPDHEKACVACRVSFKPDVLKVGIKILSYLMMSEIRAISGEVRAGVTLHAWGPGFHPSQQSGRGRE